MASSTAQRRYEAPCPGCGAPVAFCSAQSTHAICAYCSSMVVRKGEVLSRMGKMAELFDDHSPLQLQTSGVWNNQSFTLVGRLQYQYAQGTWNEWYALFDDGTTAYLAEDNGAYVWCSAAPVQRDMPDATRFRIGATTAINGKSFQVSSNITVSLRAAAGELPRLPPLGHPHAMVELRNPEGEVLSIDYGSTPPAICIGRAVQLEALQLRGLRDISSKNEQGRQFSCPHCGAPITQQLPNSKSLTCQSCRSLIDLSAGIGGELRHAEQSEPVNPLIALGTVGKLQGVDWQVVGFQHRTGHDNADPDEHFGWEEYLLYNAKRGFTFLVDATDGWSTVRPATGTPTLSTTGTEATYLGTRYRQDYSYTAETQYVLGEFYWQVQRGQKSFNRDFSHGDNLLCMEQTRNERTWSVGRKVNSDTVAKAFGLERKKDLLKRHDVSPISSESDINWVTTAIVVVLFLFVILAESCSECDPYTEDCSRRSAGGSYGGFSTGGGHK